VNRDEEPRLFWQFIIRNDLVYRHGWGWNVPARKCYQSGNAKPRNYNHYNSKPIHISRLWQPFSLTAALSPKLCIDGQTLFLGQDYVCNGAKFPARSQGLHCKIAAKNDSINTILPLQPIE